MKRLSSFLRENPHLYYILLLPAFLICFFSIEALIPPEKVRWWVSSPLDSFIPFLEIFVIPYCLWYPLLFATGFLLLFSDVPTFKAYMLFLSIGFGAALLFCLLVPNGQPLRPEVFPRENIFTSLVAALYAADTPTNVFPSMHVIGSVAAAAAAIKSPAFRRLRSAWIIVAVAICLSTVFIKQHSILDVFGGLVLSAILYFPIYRRKRH